MSQPQYKALTYTIAVGAAETVHIQCDFVTCLDATSPFRISFAGAPATDFQAGLTFDATGPIDHVRVQNTGTEPLVVTLGFGRGGIRDSRLTIGNNVLVSDDDAGQTSFLDVVNALESVVKRLKDDNTTDLNFSTRFYNYGNAHLDIVSAARNVAGVCIEMLHLSAPSGSGVSFLVGGDLLFNAANGEIFTSRNIIVPPGMSISKRANGGQSVTTMIYKVL